MEDHELFFDNLFTRHELLIGTQLQLVLFAKIGQNFALLYREMQKKKERGYFEKQFDKEGEVLVVRWKDNKAVATNYSDVTPIEKAKRFSRKQQGKISIPIPRLYCEYNRNMGGVDLLDKQISLYRTRIRSKKWWWPIFTQFLDVAIVNTWRLYQVVHPEENVSVLDIRREIVQTYLSIPKAPQNRPGPQKSKISGRVGSEVRYDRLDHLIVCIDTQRRCAACGKKTTRICKRCDIPLHDKCFAPFHTP